MIRSLRFLCLFLSLVALVKAFSGGGTVLSSRSEPIASIVCKSEESTGATTTEETKESGDVSTTISQPHMPPVIQQIADERRQYQMNLGKAMDVLRRDMQDILTKQPDFSIYTDDVSLVDPSGVQLSGLDKYKSAFSFFQTFVGFWFRPKSSGVQFRMVYDFARSSIRISWHAVLMPKVSLLGGGKPLFVDGISYYQLDRMSGMIHEHRIEKLMINNTPVVPPYGIWSLLQQDALRGLGQQRGGVGVPVGVGALSSKIFSSKRIQEPIME